MVKPQPRPIFASVNTGLMHTCGVRADGSVKCWGSNEDFHGNEVGHATPLDRVTTTETSTTIYGVHGNLNAKCEEIQAFGIDLRGQTGAEQTWQIIVAPSARPRTWPYLWTPTRLILRCFRPAKWQARGCRSVVVRVAADANVDGRDSDDDPLLYTAVRKNKSQAGADSRGCGSRRQREEAQWRVSSLRGAVEGTRGDRADSDRCRGS